MVMPSGADGRVPRVTPLPAPRQRTAAKPRRSNATTHGPTCCPPAGGRVRAAPLPPSRSTARWRSWTLAWFSRRIRRDRRQRVDLSVAPCEHWRQICFVTNSLGQRRADPEGETAQHRPITIWSANTGVGEGMWPRILGPLHRLVGGLSDASIRSLLSDTFIHAHVSGGRALTGVAESSGSRVAAFGPCS